MIKSEHLKCKIVVADDVPSARRVVRRLLEKLGFTNIEECADGAAVLDRVRRGDIGLVISDLEMPKLNGIELAKAMRALEVTKGVPVLVITSHAEKEMIIESMKVGISDFMVKPFNIQTLEDKVSKILSGEANEP